MDAALQAFGHAGEASLLGVLDPACDDPAAAQQIATAGVLGSDRYRALSRLGLGSARGFGYAWRELQDLRDRSQTGGWNAIFAVDTRFGNEPACRAHLIRRYQHGDCGCHACGVVAEGSFIAARGCWQCRRCQAQTGLRVGTCMERSSILLTKWFAAIRVTLLLPTVAAEDLAVFLQISRRQTVRDMVKKIRAAAAAPDATSQLAGLDRIYNFSN